MRDLEINKVQIFYALYQGKVPVVDSEGNETGEYTSGYTSPMPTRLRVSPNKGSVDSNTFGLTLDYDSTMVTTGELPIDEFSILWIGAVPETVSGTYPIGDDGNQITGHTHTVVRVAKDIGVVQYAIKKVN